MLGSKQTRRNQTILMGILLGLLCILFVWKARRGFPTWDESTYISLIHRFYLGDLPIIEEWHPTQFSALLHLPLYSLFVRVNGSTEGVILFYRYLFIVIQLVVSLFIYHKVKEYGWISIPIVLIYDLFVINQLVSIHYTNVSFACMVVFSLLVCFPSNHPKRDAYLAGIFYAIATLCTPHLALAYVFGSILLFVFKKRETIQDSLKQWPMVTLGILTMVLIYVAILMMKAPLSAYLSSLGNVLANQDHGGGIFQWVINTLALGKMIWMENTFTLVLVPIYFLLFVICFFDQRRFERKVWYLLGAIILAILLMFAYRNEKTNYAMLVFVPLGLFLFLLSEKKHPMLLKMYLIGIIYVLMINLSSNTIINASRCACVVCMIPTLLLLNENVEDHMLLKVGMLLLCLSMLGVELYDKIVKFDGDKNLNELVVQIKEGPLKGIYTTVENLQSYTNKRAEVQSILTESKDHLLVLGYATYLYLDLKSPDEYGTHTVWLKPNRPEEIEYMQNYYEALPEEKPDSIWVDQDYESYLPYFNDNERIVVEGN